METKTPKIKLFLALAIASLACGTQAASAPANAHQQAITNARAGRFDAALPMLERLVQQNPNNPVYRYDWIAVLSWSNRHADALAASQALNFTAKVPDYVVSAIGKSALNGGQPQRAEAAYRCLLARHAQDTDAAQGLVIALQAQQFPVFAVAVAPPAPPAAPTRDWSAEQARSGAHIRAAIAVLDTDFSPARYAPMDAALAENSTLTREAVAANQMAIARRLRLDHIVGLQARGASSQALNEFNVLEAEGDPLPAYALNAAADAQMSLRQPEQARALYQRALAADPGNGGTQTGLMYAELEAENFPGMEQIVQQRLDATQRSAAARRTEVSALRFADRIEPAAAAMAQLNAEFPDDVGLWLD
uniref:tetratricopeptide repeat protein n=1 Tax=Rhodoferax sp. TaxID=50421 RepID=UPI0025FE153A